MDAGAGVLPGALLSGRLVVATLVAYPEAEVTEVVTTDSTPVTLSYPHDRLPHQHPLADCGPHFLHGRAHVHRPVEHFHRLQVHLDRVRAKLGVAWVELSLTIQGLRHPVSRGL